MVTSSRLGGGFFFIYVPVSSSPPIVNWAWLPSCRRFLRSFSLHYITSYHANSSLNFPEFVRPSPIYTLAAANAAPMLNPLL